MTGAFVAKLGGNALALLPDAIAAADGRSCSCTVAVRRSRR